MSDGGGGESSRINNSTLKKRTKKDEFTESLARIAVAQICESVGFRGFQQSALDTLSDITCKYIQDIGKTSNFYANLAGRTESNMFDIVHGLEDLGLSQGFTGASDIDHCFSESGIIKEISQYIGVSEEVGFAYSIPPFPVIKERLPIPSFFHAGKTPPVDHIPPWLPCFPDPNTYTTLASDSTEQTETRHDRVDQDQKVMGLPLLNNPFLAFPLECGEKEVSLVSLPARLVEEEVARNHSLWAKHLSELGSFAPVIHGFNSRDADNEESRKDIVVERSRSVQLKFQISKTCSGNLEAMSWFTTDDELRDDKKRRKEKILMELLENGKHTEMMQM
ncbi:transcription initiation factor TFIID subunit 8 [Lactuca sativa]|uniref:Bromodomain associated domain-containing protein n=1 Tax=Lactuca sativa TaxID=4236 RepID=A0A9R1WB75_LACSA|nr:transcription initiation factor TFIID subunit 8 [Lactuca sativa]KAJ0219702.1 hypothetical protein LSAT_V11C200082320 [Lactuca sativa]